MEKDIKIEKTNKLSKEDKDWIKGALWGALLPCGIAAGHYEYYVGVGLIAASVTKRVFAGDDCFLKSQEKLGWTCGVVTAGAVGAIIAGAIHHPKAAVEMIGGIGVAMAAPAYKKAKEWIVERNLSRSNGE